MFRYIIDLIAYSWKGMEERLNVLGLRGEKGYSGESTHICPSYFLIMDNLVDCAAVFPNCPLENLGQNAT